MGCREHPTSSSSIVKDLVSTAAPLTLAVQGAHVANAAVSKIVVAVQKTRSRAHGSRRGGRRTRTLVQAGYNRGLQPVECPRRQKKPPEVALGRLVSVYRSTTT
jgi:hypothetical protein